MSNELIYQYALTRKAVFLLLSTVLLSFNLFGCATTGSMRYYFYKGQPQVKENVALIVMQRNLYPVGLKSLPAREDLWPFSAENPSPMKMPYTFDVAPGGYTLRVVYFHGSVAVGDPINYEIQAESGKIYYLYSKTLQNGKWQLFMKEFASADDVKAFTSTLFEDKEDGKAILERAERHFAAAESHSVYAD